LITGGSKGIGYAIAESFAREGVNLILVSRNSSDLDHAKKQLQQNYQVHIETIAADLSESQAILVVFLASNKAAYISGDVYHVDGGHNARGSSFS
jgi:short-subunit dehydrogenase